MNDIAKKTGTEIALPGETEIVSFFADTRKVDGIISQLEKIVLDFKPDLTTAKGRKEIASLSAKVSKSKVYLDTLGKRLNETRRAEIDLVDKERRKIRDRLDALRNQARKPLTEWEDNEERRLANIRERLSNICESGLSASDKPAEIQTQIDFIHAIDPATFEEFSSQAEARRENTLYALQAHLLQAQEREKMEAELEALRSEKAARVQAEEQRAEADRIAKDEEERRRLAHEREEQRARDQKEAEARVRDEAERRAAQAVEDERRRVADQIIAEAADRRKRAEDEAHLTAIKSAISDALAPIPRERIANALIDGMVPYVKVLI